MRLVAEIFTVLVACTAACAFVNARWRRRSEQTIEEVRLAAADVMIGVQADLIKKGAAASVETTRRAYLDASEMMHNAFEAWRPERWGAEATEAGFPPVAPPPGPEEPPRPPDHRPVA